MTDDRAVEVQTAVRLLMTTDSTLMTTLGVDDVYDVVPSDASFPYIRVSDMNIVAQAIKVEDWFDYFITLHIWSQNDGTAETRNILSRLYELFHRQEITVAGTNLSSYVLNSLVTGDPDGVTHHGIIRLRLVD